MNGFLLIHKPVGMTSHDVVSKVRRYLHIRQVGHTGTLDPQASGVLLVFVGKACKVLQFIDDTDKEYIATLRLGESYDTEDIWGELLETKEIVPIEDIDALCASFVGKQQQLPPMYSSIKVNGKKLYEYARNKEEVERPLRDIEVYDFTCLNKDKLQFQMHVSSGTYVRSLLRDFAIKSGNIGSMDSLIRSRIGRFSLEECVTLEDVEAGKYTLHPILEVLDHLPQVDDANLLHVSQGKPLDLNNTEEQVLILKDKEAYAIYERRDDGRYYSKRGLW